MVSEVTGNKNCNLISLSAYTIQDFSHEPFSGAILWAVWSQGIFSWLF